MRDKNKNKTVQREKKKPVAARAITEEDIVMAPTVGRIVHYTSHGTPVREDGSQAYTACCRAAVITSVHSDEVVGLAVLNPTGLFFHEHVDYGLGGGTWHWPERAKEMK